MKFRERGGQRAAHYEHMHNTFQLFTQAGMGDMWKLRKVHKAGGDVDWHNPKWRDGTALMNAGGQGQLEALNFLIDQDAKLDEQNREGVTAAMECVVQGELGCLKSLIDAGCDLNKTDSVGRTALSLACDAENLDIARMLLQNGADQTIYDHEGNWPFIKACAQAQEDLIKLLIKFGVPIYQEHRDGFTAIQLAERCGHRDVVELIKRSVEEIERKAAEQAEIEEALLDAQNTHI
eukprot:g5921.t1